ncbi:MULTISPECIES: calcium-binding protein [Methylobacterium]|uniref:Bifunctional hemolysin/adenylate cyclase n=1 Tax=Methylobacterium bullatum TaxID=570505 RepID=A0AAV4Z044_9HYPH|nr:MULTISPECIES: calcium-binding protein [Methylobacterium]GJD37605.1 hypothetical protein OICFNHDK_0042 [Methylobacterium bullatum]
MAEIRCSYTDSYDEDKSVPLELSSFAYNGVDSFYKTVLDSFFGLGFYNNGALTRYMVPSTVSMLSLYLDFSDNKADVNFDGGTQGDVLRGGLGDDVLNGGGGNDILEGGGGINTIDGGAGTNTLSYEHFDAPTGDGSGGVDVDLRIGKGYDFASENQQDIFVNIANIRGSQYDDVIAGSVENNVIEGGAGADYMTGGGGVDTLSYAHSTAGVTVDLAGNSGLNGDAQQDAYFGFLNVIGSTSGDTLYGDGGANTLNGNGGSDELYGRDGNDRLVISSSPVRVDGGEGTDLLFVNKGSVVVLTDDSFTSTASIEKIYVRDGASLTMTGVDVGTKIFSQSVADSGSTIVGTDGADRIVAGKGSDIITGGAGGDSLFGGAGADTFVFAAGDGRDVIRKFDALNDRIVFSGLDDDTDRVDVLSFQNGDSTLITVTHEVGPTDKIILLGVTADSLLEISFIL